MVCFTGVASHRSTVCGPKKREKQIENHRETLQSFCEFFQNFRKFLDVCEFFSKFSEVFRSFWTCSDAFGCDRMCSDALVAGKPPENGNNFFENNLYFYEVFKELPED